MFGRKKDAPKEAPAPRKSGGGKALMSQLGIADVDMFGADLGGVDDFDDGDEDLEAELRALQEEGGDSPALGGRRANQRDKAKVDVKAMANLDRMIAASMNDVGSDDEDVSDTEAPDLLAELEALSMDEDEPPPIKQPKGHAQSSPPPPVATRPSASFSSPGIPRSVGGVGGPSSPQALPRKPPSPVVASSHGTVHPPPQKVPVYHPTTAGTISSPVSAAAPRPAPSVSAPVVTRQAPVVPPIRQAPPAPVRTSSNSSDIAVPANLSAEDAEKCRMLTSRRNQYKMAAVQAKRAGDEETAKNYIRVSKQFDGVIKALEEGKPVDLSKMPPPPPAASSSSAPGRVVHERALGSSAAAPTPRLAAAAVESEEPLPDLTQEDKKKLFNAPESASTVMEALEQRLSKYKEAEAQAKEEGNTSKASRQGRIVKQYLEAIKLYKAGKPVEFEELPCPPGFPPIPIGRGPTNAAPPSSAQSQLAAAAPARAAAPQVTAKPAAPVSSVGASTAKPGLQKQMSMSHSRADQQAAFLEDRQAQFKAAAMQAKASGDMELAKKYLRMAKGFDQMISASKSGLPVDLAQVPAPPDSGNESGFEFVKASDCSGGGSGGGVGGADLPSGDRGEMYKKLQEDLVKQIKMSESNRDHFTKLGDVSSATKFDKMCQNSRKDLEALKNAYEHGDPVPRFHYEACHFSLVQSCTELGDNDLEVIVVRGLNYNLPTGFAATDLNTYVKMEFPFPDTPQVGDTACVKATNCPEYDHTFKLEVNRKSRAFLRLLKSSKVLKLDVYYKRGFLKGDKLLGSVAIKLQPLEDKCIYHDSYDLMENRKAVGGKLEVKVRVRDPFLNKQVESISEKWLTIDQFERREAPQPVPRKEVKPKPAPASSASGHPSSSHAPSGHAPGTPHFSASMSVLQYERQQLDQQIAKYAGKLKPAEVDSLRQRGAQLDRQAEGIKEQLHKGGANAYRAYVDAMTQLHAGYAQEARQLAANQVAANSKEKLQNILTKRKLVEKEIETLRHKLGIS